MKWNLRKIDVGFPAVRYDYWARQDPFLDKSQECSLWSVRYCHDESPPSVPFHTAEHPFAVNKSTAIIFP